MAKKGYWIAHVNITNPERYKDYVAANAAPLKKHPRVAVASSAMASRR